jgi:hypothetical protein
MDRRERMNDPLVALQAALKGWQADVWTALPGIIQSFDSAKMTCVVQPSIQAQVRDKAGKWTNTTLPVLVDCPVIFPAGGGYALTLPLTKDDECLVVFSSRCIDAVYQQGGVQPQAEFRMHDLSDGFAIPGWFSQPRVIENISTTKAELRTADGELAVSIDKTTGIVTVKAPTKITLDAPIVEMTGVFSALNQHAVGVTGTIQGSIHVQQNVTADGQVSANGIGLTTHHHTDVQPGGGNTGGPAG